MSAAPRLKFIDTNNSQFFATVKRNVDQYFKENNIKPDSKSAIEKKLFDLRENLNAKNNIEMIVMCKDIGII